MITALHHAHELVTLAGDIPNPGAKTPNQLTTARDTLLGWLKWGGYSIAAGSIILSGIKMLWGSGGGRGATTAADAAVEIPWKVLGVALISGGAGLLGTFVGG
ncbi:hypothetical protein ABZ851_36875 [Streptomyces sp. NPDC047049]|uniref:hypothetical protein n=1 Tax=Streptomyces sp. NPDC047049 TaxID=3156688 RepID=UPI0033C6E9FE